MRSRTEMPSWSTDHDDGFAGTDVVVVAGGAVVAGAPDEGRTAVVAVVTGTFPGTVVATFLGAVVVVAGGAVVGGAVVVLDVAGGAPSASVTPAAVRTDRSAT
jgi:hypothetical protein